LAWATELNRFTVVYDACVLYAAPIRDLLMRLALTDLSRQQLERTRSLMNAHVRDGLVDGHQPLIPALELPDPDDRHVLAADADRVCTAMRQHRASLKNPPKTVEEYLATIEDQGLSRFSQAVRHYAAEI
jgi:hypothetical protein